MDVEIRISIGKVITSIEGLRHCADALEKAGHYDDTIMEHFIMIYPDGRITTGIDLDKTSDKCELSSNISFGEELCTNCNGSGVQHETRTQCYDCKGKGVLSK